MSNVIKLRGVMASLFKDEEAKEIIKTFESALEMDYGCDSHYVYDVNLEKDASYNSIQYTHDEIQAAFRLCLYYNLQTLPNSLYHYLYDDQADEELFNKFYNNER